MTKKLNRLLSISLISLFIISCNKSIDKLPAPSPENADTTAYAQFTVNGLQQEQGQLYALVTIENSNDVPVVNTKKVTVDFIQGTYKSDKIALAKGTYKLSKFIIVKASDTAFYAAPKANTAKAGQVTKPLALDLSITQKGINLHTAEVIKINNTDNPSAFGYNTADFGFLPYLNITGKIKMSVGEVVYDNLPGKIKITAVDNNGNSWIREQDFQKGVNSIRVPENYTAYTFETEKFGVHFTRQFTRQQLTNNFLVEMDANRLPKLLRKETSFIENYAGFTEDSRTEYFYAAGNKLQHINYYQRLPQYADLQFQHTYKFVYDGFLLDTIKRYSPDNILNGFTAFTYSGNKITAMHNNSFDQQTFAAVEYGGTESNPQVTIDYLFSNGNSMVYRMNYSGGNKVNDQAQSSTGGTQSGVYEYDSNINPYHQLGYPDIFFTNTSKNNRIMEQGTYGGSIPSVVAYKFEYVYDNDGYPSVLYTSYKGYTSGQHLYRIKKVFQYQ